MGKKKLVFYANPLKRRVREANEKLIYKKLKKILLRNFGFFNLMFGITETFGEEIFQHSY